jgi:PAS domain S-box-containing protein
MTIDPQVLRSEQHDEIGQIIARDADSLIDRWSDRAVAEQPNAARVHHRALRDHLASFLRTLGQTLAESTSPVDCPHCEPAERHGEQRWGDGWSLSEVVRDYQILRLVLFDHLQQTLERPLLAREIQAIGLALDESITASVDAYVRQRDEHVRRVEAEGAEQQRLAEEVRQQWDLIFQHAGWGIALVNPAYDTLRAANPAFARMHGYTPQELVGRPLAGLVAPEFRAALADDLRAADRDGHHGYELTHLRRDGTRFPTMTQVTALTDKAGAVLFRALDVQDITDRKRMEESLRTQAAALEAADRRKNEFLAVLAHELRNPLAPILTSVEVLRLLGPGDANVAQARDIVERQVRQMVRLVDDLLDVTRIAQGKVELRRTAFDLASAVAEAVQTTAPLFEAQRHRLAVQLPDGPLRLQADQARVVQILVNLLANAAKYTDPGGRVTLTGAREGDEIFLNVRDTGVGIGQDMLGRVFDLFAQAEGARGRSRGGLGIGLTLVRQLAELHGGTVAAHSDGPGKGSTFTVRLPAAAGARPEAPPPPAPERAGPGRRHVLVAEDDYDTRSTLETLLRLVGHRAESAATGPEAVNRALALRPDVVLVDLSLPGADGYEVARRLRAALGDAVVLVALTAHGLEEDRRRTREAGFDAHLVKPVELAELTRLLEGLRPAP